MSSGSNEFTGLVFLGIAFPAVGVPVLVLFCILFLIIWIGQFFYHPALSTEPAPPAKPPMSKRTESIVAVTVMAALAAFLIGMHYYLASEFGPANGLFPFLP